MREFHQFMVVLIGIGLAMNTASCTQHQMADETASDYFSDARDVALAQAAAEGDTAEMETMVAQGANVNAKGEDGLTMFFWVYGSKKKDGFKKLQELGADPLLKAKGGRTVAFYTVRDVDPEYLQILLEGGLDPNARKPSGAADTLLMESAVNGSWAHFELLLAYCADLNWTNEFGSSAASAAISGLNMDLVVRLLEEGYSYNLREGLGRSLDIVRIDPASPQYQWEQKAIKMLEAKGVVFPVDDGKLASNALPHTEPIYAESCLERKLEGHER